MTVRELIEKLEELGYAGDRLEIGFRDNSDMGSELVIVSDVTVEKIIFSTKNENWHPVNSPQVSFKGVKKVVILS
jgi:hypothetical protein